MAGGREVVVDGWRYDSGFSVCLTIIMLALLTPVFMASIAAAASSADPLISFNISFTTSPLMKMLEDGVHPKLIEATYLKPNVTNDSIPLFRYLDNEFYGEILLGHPGQKFKVIFDTSWANTWVPSMLCSELYPFCKTHNKYNSWKSSTKKDDGRTIKIPYGNSSLNGFLSMDLLHLGHINVTNMTFMEATEVPTNFPQNMMADGVVGLAFRSLSILNVTPFVDKLTEEKKFKKVFSFYFNRDSATKKGGTLFFGGSQKKHYTGNFTYINLISADYWRFPISSVRIKGSSRDVCEDIGCPAIVDTSSTSITAPRKIIEFINIKIGAKKFIGDLHKVDCNIRKKLPSLTFIIGGREFVFKSRDYIRVVPFNESLMMCLSVFEANDLVAPFQNYWTLGVSFMARFYVEFDADKKRIGFADVRM